MSAGPPAPGYRSSAETGRRHALWDLAKKADDSVRHRLALIDHGAATGTLTPAEREYLLGYIAALEELAAMIRRMPGHP